MGPAFIAAIGYIVPVTLRPIFRRVPASAISYCGCRLGQPDGDADSDPLCQTGIATGKNLAEQIRDHYPRPVGGSIGFRQKLLRWQPTWRNLWCGDRF